MPKEIEYKYLINLNKWKTVQPEKSIEIKQGYLSDDPDKTIRIRTADDKAWLTIKGRNKGAVREEFEHEIELGLAESLLEKFCDQLIEKTRHLVHSGKHRWEVDEFHGENQGLLVAEIELQHEDEVYTKPDWVEKNVTDDPRYYNSNLAKNPFKKWPD
ncbi:MAG: CYTH domain-containing protein [Crocinitomicaceae bacterium]|nr:CYTH domain-containing protein [Crocinitomicaceae bacterium]MBK8926913.1 CYTH domain-containing protein [Crocinitomicaceae bacterium]